MIKVIFTALLFSSSLVFASEPLTCPNLNGHYTFSEFAASADAVITQTDCTSMEIKVAADVLGTKYNEDVSSPLDGVTREYPSPNGPSELDYASAEFNGTTVVFLVERDVTDSSGKVTKSHNEVQGILTSPNVLQITSSDVDANGNLSNSHTFNFNRVSN